MGVQHQRLVSAGLGGLDAGEDAVELGVTVDPRVLHVRRTAPHMHGGETHATLDDLGVGLLVLGDDDDGGRTHRDARVLVGGGLETPGHH